MIVDQSYSGEVARSIRRSSAHGRVAVYAATKDTDYSTGGEYTQGWLNSNHTYACMQNIHKVSIYQARVQGGTRPLCA